MRDFVTKDSGERDEFVTGSVRDSSAEKIRPELMSPLALKRLAGLYARGAVKYGDRNWEKGQPMVRTTGSLFRHLLAFMCGETDEDHLAAIAWNAMALIHTEECIALGILPPELDDMPHYFGHEEFYGPDDNDFDPVEVIIPVSSIVDHQHCSFCGRDQGKHDRSCDLYDRAAERERDEIASETRIREAIAKSWHQPNAEERLADFNAGIKTRD